MNVWFLLKMKPYTLNSVILFLLHEGSMPSRLAAPPPWMSPTQYFYCACCSPMGGGGVAQPQPILSGGSPYNSVTHVRTGQHIAGAFHYQFQDCQ